MDRALVSFELLEGRKLLSATLENGVLTVTGTRHGDKMEISLDHEDPTKLNVQVNDETSSFSLADITGGFAAFLDNSDAMRREVLHRVPFGTPIKQAQSTMESAGFHCRTNLSR